MHYSHMYLYVSVYYNCEHAVVLYYTTNRRKIRILISIRDQRRTRKLGNKRTAKKEVGRHTSGNMVID